MAQQNQKIKTFLNSMQGYHTGLPHLLFPSKQHIKHDKRVKQCLKLKTPAGRRAHSMRKKARRRRAHSMRKNARRLGGTTPCAKTPTSWASALHAQKSPPARLGQHQTQKRPPEAGQHSTQKRPPAGGPTPCAKTPAGRRANTMRKNARRQAGQHPRFSNSKSSTLGRELCSRPYRQSPSN